MALRPLLMGPDLGTKKRADVILAGTDRVVGIAILKELGSNRAIIERKIFKQEQIARAVELDLGIRRPEDIDILTDDEKGRVYADRIRKILLNG